MIRSRTAVVHEIIEQDDNTTEILIKSEDGFHKAINYNRITGSVRVNDKILVNTNATYLSLGTGGYDYVISNISNGRTDFDFEKGHIIKLRYTPMQIRCLAVEEEDSPYHQTLKDKYSVEGLKVIILPLHSMLAPAVHILKQLKESIRISYIMTDSACLPLSFSKTVKDLKRQQLLDSTITSGQSFGGDFEAVNLYSALVTAKYVCTCDIAIVSPGPGVVGTNTLLGFSGAEGGALIDAVNLMKGMAFYVPRISFSDRRERHYGLSHHSITVLSRLAFSRAHIALPLLSEEKKQVIIEQLNKNKLYKKHDIQFVQENVIDMLRQRNVKVNTMERGLEEDPEFFRTVGSSVILAMNISE
ncbi:MAG: DUF3866 family protein [Clostridia bacterium]